MNRKKPRPPKKESRYLQSMSTSELEQLARGMRDRINQQLRAKIKRERKRAALGRDVE